MGGGVETLAQMVCGSSSVNKHIFFHPRAPLSLICTPIQFVQSNTKSTVVTIVVNLIVLSAIKEIKLELAHRRNLLATGGGLVSIYPYFASDHISLSRYFVFFTFLCAGGNGEPGIGKPVSGQPGQPELKKFNRSGDIKTPKHCNSFPDIFLNPILKYSGKFESFPVSHFSTLLTWSTLSW